MTARTISYWLTSSVIELDTLAGRVTDLAHGRTAIVAGEPAGDIVVTRLGYPTVVLTILRTSKLADALALLVSRVPRLKRWAYAGIGRRS